MNLLDYPYMIQQPLVLLFHYLIVGLSLVTYLIFIISSLLDRSINELAMASNSILPLQAFNLSQASYVKDKTIHTIYIIRFFLHISHYITSHITIKYFT